MVEHLHALAPDVGSLVIGLLPWLPVLPSTVELATFSRRRRPVSGQSNVNSLFYTSVQDNGTSAEHSALDKSGFYSSLVVPPPDSFFGDNPDFYRFVLAHHLEFVEAAPYPLYPNQFSFEGLNYRAVYTVSHLSVQFYRNGKWNLVRSFDEIDLVFVPAYILSRRKNLFFRLSTI